MNEIYNSTYADAQAAYLAATPFVPDNPIGLCDFELLITQGLGEALERQNKRVAFLANKDTTGLTDTQIQQALYQYHNAKRDALCIDFAIKLVKFYTQHIIQIETKFINMEHTKDLLARLLEFADKDAEMQAIMIKTIDNLNNINKKTNK